VRAVTRRARKVSGRSPRARNASPGTDLISPSNNHDLYSIEDLAELIERAEDGQPDLRVSVKSRRCRNIGTIGLGIAKAGADIITLSGFEGGTSGAHQHALGARWAALRQLAPARSTAR
jgi:glutamate synthase (NADPH/NADH) large chain